MGSQDLGVKGQMTTGVRGQIWPNWSNYTQNCRVILRSDQHGSYGLGVKGHRGQRSNLAKLVQLYPKNAKSHPQTVGSDEHGVIRLRGQRSTDHRGHRPNLGKLVQLYPKLPRVILRQWGVIGMGSFDLGVKGQVTTGVRGQIWLNWSNYTYKQNIPAHIALHKILRYLSL